MPNYVLEGPSWRSATITWSFAVAGGTFSAAIGPTYQAVIEAAIARWAGVSTLSFHEVSDTTPGVDIRIGWGLFSNGQVGEADYAYTVGTTENFVPGTTVRLEDPSAEPVDASQTSHYQGTSTTLYQVALHEIGHDLGLDHSQDPNAVMYAVLGAQNVDLDATDIAGIQALYGATAGAATAAITAAAPGLAIAGTLLSGQVPIYRFFDTVTGSQFLTGSSDERDTLLHTRPDLIDEGVGMAGIDPVDSDDPNAVPVYRFFETTNGTHLLTISPTEVATIENTRPDLVPETSTFDEHRTPQAGDTAVYRFFETTDGTHFFTASDTERATLLATRPDMTFEGIAFYAPTIA